MKALELFKCEDHGVRVVGTADNPLFVAKDVCEALGYTKFHNTN